MLKQSFYWAPYDPEHFISLRRIKHRLSRYVHQPIPYIEQHANQQEWVEGILDDEELTEEEKLEREMKEIEKRIDLDYVAQVTFTQPQPVGASTSTSTSSRQPAKEAISSVGKGKEIEHSERQSTMEEKSSSNPEKGQEQSPSTQTKAPEIPVMQTPHNEERGKKRDRTDDTPTGTSTDQQGEKRQRLNPYAEEEITEETIGNIRGEGTSEQ